MFYICVVLFSLLPTLGKDWLFLQSTFLPRGNLLAVGTGKVKEELGMES